MYSFIFLGLGAIIMSLIIMRIIIVKKNNKKKSALSTNDNFWARASTQKNIDRMLKK